jgi:uncharacterized Zn finger protein
MPEAGLSSALEKLLTQPALAKLAGESYYARGAAYFRDGAVLDLVQTRDALNARVSGSEEYRVSLRAVGRKLDWSCSCPLGDEGEFCKHAVATGLAWLARRKEGGADGDELAPLRMHLGSLEKEALVELLLEQAAEDPELRAQLEGAALRHAAPADLKTLKETVRRAFDVRGFEDYRGMRALVARAGSVADLLQGLLKSGRSAQAVALADYALERGMVAYENSDDSGGGLSEVLHTIAELHLQACRAAKPLEEAFGEALFKLQMRDDWGFFRFEDYAPLLSAKALARYRALAEETWRSVSSRKAGQQPHEPRIEADGHFNIRRIMEVLARHSGDIDALVAVKSRHLTHAYSYLQIAQILAEAKRHDEALAWAERGHKAFPRRMDSRLVEFLMGAYRRAGREADGVARAWELFEQQPGLEAYKLLKKACGSKEWPGWRVKALDHLRARTQQRTKQAPHWAVPGSTVLVDIFLHEGDSDAALAEARAGGCMGHQWMQIAAARETDHPQDAVEIYQKQIDPIITLANNRAYDEATVLVRKIGELMKKQKKAKEFGEWLAALRERHGAKRNLMKRLEGVG